MNNNLTWLFKYLVTISLMVILVYILYTFKNDAIRNVRNEINNIEVKIAEKVIKTKELESERTSLQELIIDKYIDYSSYVLSGVSIIMTVMILFTFRDFERLDQLKEEYVQRIREVDNKMNYTEKLISDFETEKAKILIDLEKQKITIINTFNEKSESFIRIATQNKNKLVKSHTSIIDSSKELADKQNYILQSLDNSIKNLSFIASTLKDKNILSQIEFIHINNSLGKILLESSEKHTKIMGINSIRNFGSQNEIKFLYSKIKSNANDDDILKAITDAINYLENKR